ANAYDQRDPGLYNKILFCRFRPPATIIYATYFGSQWYWNSLKDAIIDNDESIIFTGYTHSSYFPTTSDAFDSTFNSIDSTVFSDMFLSRLSADLSHLDYSTYIGSTYGDISYSLTPTDNGSVWLAGVSRGWGFPITTDAYQPENNGWEDACFLSFEVPNSSSVELQITQFPGNFSLSVFPNPFNPSTTISFTLPRQAQTSLEVFNVLGQAVYSVNLGQLPAGEYHHHLNAASLPSGTYLTRLDAGEMQEVKKMAVVR
ncbi:T9SS type A sorting domain-containing protein, partial [bacterium]|nr:T9SS type A sorting domain-containing protein [bacterium]